MRRATLFLAPLLLLACDRQPVAPEVTPGFDGASVLNEIQFRNPARLTWLDTDRDAGEPWDVMLLGYDPASHPSCNDGEYGPGIPVREHIVVAHMAEEFDLNDPGTWDQGEAFNDHVTIVGNAPLYMYSRATLPLGGSPEEWCEYYQNDWIASGQWTGTLYTDNDYTYLDYTPGMNVYGQNEHGVLQGTDGTRYTYVWKWKALYMPEHDMFRVLYNLDQVTRIGN